MTARACNVLEYGELETPARSDMFTGECYYKRTQASGNKRIYFRDPVTLERTCTVDAVPPGDTLFDYGEVYTIDFAADPIVVTTRSHPPAVAP